MRGATSHINHTCRLSDAGIDSTRATVEIELLRMPIAATGCDVSCSCVSRCLQVYSAILCLECATIRIHNQISLRLRRCQLDPTILLNTPGAPFQLPAYVAGRSLAWEERRNYDATPLLRVWPGPQWNLFSEADRAAFLEQTWTVAAQSDRVGYRLSGKALAPRQWQMISEPLQVGAVQVPEDGQPIVMMRDGPTVGGYPKLGVVDAHDVARLAQCRPGRGLKFRLAAPVPA